MLSDAPRLVKNNKKSAFKDDEELKQWLMS